MRSIEIVLWHEQIEERLRISHEGEPAQVSYYR